MGGSLDDIEALLVDVRDVDNPTPGMLPAVFRDIVGRLDAGGYAYAVVGRIALTLHEQARYVGVIEIVADLGTDGRERAADLVQATRVRFAAHMDPKLCPRPIEVTLRPCTCATEAGLLAEAITRPWFGRPARLASAEHLLWLWCRSDALDHPADASALIAGGTVDLYRVQSLLRETDNLEETGQTRLRLAIGNAVLSTTSSFNRYMSERRARLDPYHVPVWRRVLEDRDEAETSQSCLKLAAPPRSRSACAQRSGDDYVSRKRTQTGQDGTSTCPPHAPERRRPYADPAGIPPAHTPSRPPSPYQAHSMGGPHIPLRSRSPN